MTIKELYEFAVENQCEDYDIKVFNDYSPYEFDFISDLTIDTNNKNIILWADEPVVLESDTQVYCSQCKHLDYDYLNKVFTCKYEKECDIWDVEDSKPFSERPHYKSINRNI